MFLIFILLVSSFVSSAYALSSDKEENETISETKERYVEDLATVDWDNVCGDSISLWLDDAYLGNNYKWKITDFPELELSRVVDYTPIIDVVLK